MASTINDIKNLTNDELLKIIGEKVIGTPSGLDAQHAQAELNKRLIDGINSLDKNTTAYSRMLVILTILLFFVALLQIVVSLMSISDMTWVGRTVMIIIVLCSIFFLARFVFKKMEK